MDKIVKEHRQAFFNDYILDQYLDYVRKVEADRVTMKVTAELEAKRIKEQTELEAKIVAEQSKFVQEKEQTILSLRTKMNFTIEQIAVVVQRSEEYVLSVLKKYEAS